MLSFPREDGKLIGPVWNILFVWFSSFKTCYLKKTNFLIKFNKRHLKGRSLLKAYKAHNPSIP
jgi:hypothetical protein